MKLQTIADIHLSTIPNKKTRAWYNARLKKLTDWSDRDIETITAIEIKVKLAELHKAEYSENYIFGIWRTIKALFKLAQEEDIILKSPTAKIKIEKPQAHPRVLTTSERDKLIAAATNPRDRTIMLFLADTAARLQGVVNLKLIDIDLKARTVTVIEKRNKQRTLYFTDTTKAALEDYITHHRRTGSEYLFTGQRGRLRESGIYQMLKRTAKKAEVNTCNPHAWRHGAARAMLQTASIPEVSQLMGHNDITTTVHIYGRYTDTHLQQTHDAASWLINYN